MISSRRICLSKMTNSLIFILKIQNSLQMGRIIITLIRITTLTQSITLKTSMTWCLIWLLLITLVEAVLELAKPTRTQAILKLLSTISSKISESILMRQVKQKMHGTEKRTKWGKSLRNRPSTSWKIELLNLIGKLVTKTLHHKWSQMITMIVISTQLRNQKIKTYTVEVQVLWMLLKCNWTHNRLKKLNRWQQVRWGHSREIDYTQAIETVWILWMEV